MSHYYNSSRPKDARIAEITIDSLKNNISLVWNDHK